MTAIHDNREFRWGEPAWPSPDGGPPSGASVSRSAGFNLIEISLAIFVLSLGLLAIFALFPTGLGMADTARRQTQVGMFADHVFGAMRARASADSDVWIGDLNLFRDTVMFTDPFISLRNSQDVAADEQNVRHTGDTPQLVRYPHHGESDAVRHSTYLRYTLDVNMTNNNMIGTADLRVWSGRSGVESDRFYTQFYPFREVE